MLDDIVGAYGSRFFLAAGGVGIALLCLIGVLWLLRNRAPSPFVRGGKNRQPRLQVLDAAAVDARRRLVLVRRDGIEHLIMIGGPTDIVIESGISGAGKTSAMPAPSLETLPAEPARRLIRQERPAEPPRIAAPEPTAAIAAAQEPQQPYAPPPATPVHRRPDPVLAFEPARRAPPAGVHEQPVPPQPQQPIREPAAVDRTEEVEAADILDAARHRVLPQQPVRPLQAAPYAVRGAPAPGAPMPQRDENSGNSQAASAAAPAAIAPAVMPPPRRELGNDFESVLEAEMSNNLAAERILPDTPAPQRLAQPIPGQRRDPELAPITGADVALQKEVARIFGEMSVNRDK